VKRHPWQDSTNPWLHAKSAIVLGICAAMQKNAFALPVQYAPNNSNFQNRVMKNKEIIKSM
jgi:hypothetical protein